MFSLLVISVQSRMVFKEYSLYSWHSPIRVIRDLEASGSAYIEREVLTLKMGNTARGLPTFMTNASIVSLLDLSPSQQVGYGRETLPTIESSA